MPRRIRITNWRTDDPRELKLQLKLFEDYVRQLEMALEAEQQKVKRLEQAVFP